MAHGAGKASQNSVFVCPLCSLCIVLRHHGVGESSSIECLRAATHTQGTCVAVSIPKLRDPLIDKKGGLLGRDGLWGFTKGTPCLGTV